MALCLEYSKNPTIIFMEMEIHSLCTVTNPVDLCTFRLYSYSFPSLSPILTHITSRPYLSALAQVHPTLRGSSTIQSSPSQSPPCQVTGTTCISGERDHLAETLASTGPIRYFRGCAALTPNNVWVRFTNHYRDGPGIGRRGAPGPDGGGNGTWSLLATLWTLWR